MVNGHIVATDASAVVHAQLQVYVPVTRVGPAQIVTPNVINHVLHALDQTQTNVLHVVLTGT